VSDREEAAKLAQRLKSRWSTQGKPDAAEAMREHAELRRFKSVALDLAYEEYCLRSERGEDVLPAEFCDRFDICKRSLARRIEVHEHLIGDDSMLGFAQPANWPEVGETFQDAYLLEELGRGSVGRVFLARQLQLGNRLVALKLTVHGAHEATSLSKLNHPNIVPIYKFEQSNDSGLTAITMPFMGRSTLDDYLELAFRNQQRPDRYFEPLEQYGPNYVAEETAYLGAADLLGRSRIDRLSYIDGVIGMAIQLADALGHAHTKGIVHSDVKPSNVLLTPAGIPMLLDFNLAADDSATPYLVGGTLPYMSPEMVRNVFDPSDSRHTFIDGRADIFSLGVVLYELIAGKHPFGMASMNLPASESAKEIMARQKSGPAFAEACWQHQPELRQIVRQCLAFEPGDRHSTAMKLVLSLSELQRPINRAKRWQRQHPRLIKSVAASLVVATALGGTHLATRPSLADRTIAHAIDDAREENYVEAMRELDSVIVADPANVAAIRIRSEIWELQGEFNTAANSLDEAYQKSDDLNDLVLAGYCMAKGHFFEQASVELAIAFSEGFESAEAYNLAGYCFHNRREYAKAENSLRLAIQMNPQLWQAWYNLGLLYRDQLAAKNMEAFEKARDALLEANRLMPSPAIDYAIGQVYCFADRGTGQHAGKIEEYLVKGLRGGCDPIEINGLSFLVGESVDFESILETYDDSRPKPVLERLVRPQKPIL